MSESWQVCAFWYAFLFPRRSNYSLLLSLLFSVSASTEPFYIDGQQWNKPIDDQSLTSLLTPTWILGTGYSECYTYYLHYSNRQTVRVSVISLSLIPLTKSQVHCSGFPSTLNGQLTIMGAWKVTAVVSAGRKGGVGLWAPCEPSQG